MIVMGRPGCWACAVDDAQATTISANSAANRCTAWPTTISSRRRLGGELRAANAHPTPRILPQLLGRMQVAERARDSVEVVGREALGDVGVVERLLVDRRHYVLGQRRDLGIIASPAGIILPAVDVVI